MKTVTIINQYSGNKGDRAVCFYILNELSKYSGLKVYLSTNDRKNWKNERIIIKNRICLVPWGWNVEGFNPKKRLDWEKRRILRIVGFPFFINRILKMKKGLGIGRFFVNKEFYQAIKTSDFVISTGGHHLTTRFAPDLVGEIFFDICVAWLLNPRIYFWSQTFGPFNFVNRKNKNALQIILNNSAGIFVRDLNSIEEFKNLMIDSIKLSRTFESVIGLNSLINNFIPPSKRDNIIGITIYNAEYRPSKEYTAYIETMAEITDWLIEEKFTVKFFPHEIIGSVINDRDCINDIIALVKNRKLVLLENKDLSTIEHLSDIGHCRMFIGHKTHSVIFALTVGTPIIAISYHPTTRDFLKQYSLEGNAIPENELSLRTFKMVFNKMNSIIDDIGIIQFERSREIARIISDDFNKILKVNI